VLLNTDDEAFGGSGEYKTVTYKSEKKPFHGFEQSIELEIPPMSVMYLKLSRKFPKGKTNK
jgi:1,4-alpha-glucan branching enzyme